MVVYTEWMKKGDMDKGSFSIRIYDVRNNMLYEGKKNEVKLSSGESKSYGMPMNPAGFRPGQYRIDVLWNGAPVWRAGINILE